jgi:hypothetical protein
MRHYSPAHFGRAFLLREFFFKNIAKYLTSIIKRIIFVLSITPKVKPTPQIARQANRVNKAKTKKHQKVKVNEILDRWNR